VAVESAVGFLPENQYIQNLGVYRTLSVGTFSFTPGQMIYLGIKRLIDILIGIAGVILLAPVTVIVKAVYLLTGDRAPIFYSHIRVGQDGVPIRIWKYRTMVPDADKQLEILLQDENYRKEWEENQKFANDPRITKTGRILRKTSLDELPQMINILLGDMSLVGPRPLVKGELELHDGLKLYQRVKPGITGWWGCNGRSNIEYRERLELEYYYVKHCSLYLDLLCIFRTMLAVVKKDGAQ
jgi:undecaprenyl-phosphate galactose phosphotransferase